jgi:RNA polymerase sigma-70 factor (ECF subfamily)
MNERRTTRASVPGPTTPARYRRTEALWRAYRQQLLAFVRRHVDDDAIAEDLLQEVFLRMHRHPDDLADPRAWLYRVTRSAIADYYRARRPTQALPEDLAAPEGDPSESAMRELATCMRPLIERLPERYRRAVHLAEVEGCTQREVAEREGISLSGAKSRVQRGRVRLRETLTDCCAIELDRAGRIRDYEPREPGCSGC